MTALKEESRKGIAYCVGVGPGDPEYMTLKAVRLIRENEVIAVPGQVAEESVAYQIALGAVPELKDKELVAIDMPMVKDRELIRKSHEAGAKLIESYLEAGRNVVYLTLGDSTVYCTFSYLQHIMEADGYGVQLISGITSFCATAARLNMPLGEWNEIIHIIPAVHRTEEALSWEGTCVMMKSASHMKEVKDQIRAAGREAGAVERCTMEGERVYRSVDEIPDDAGYFSVIISREKHQA